VSDRKPTPRAAHDAVGISLSKKHITDQQWLPEMTDAAGTVVLKGEDGSTVAILSRPDHGSDLLVSGYICGLQMRKIADDKERAQRTVPSTTRSRGDRDLAAALLLDIQNSEPDSPIRTNPLMFMIKRLARGVLHAYGEKDPTGEEDSL
jgi:hypothetical protein